MKFAALTDRIQEKSTASDGQAIDPWAIHTLATQRVAAGADITLLSIGQEVNETTPACVVDAAIHSLQTGRHHYADVTGEEKLRQAISHYHTRLTSQTADASNVTVFAGAQNALFSLAQVLLGPEDEVILVAPYYTTYQATFGAPGPDVVTVTVDSENNYQLDVEKLISAVTTRTRVMVINAPNNPLGSRYTAEQLNTIVSVCVQQQIWLILDSVYLDIVSPESIALPHSIPGANDILITVGSLSKSHRMTGWRIGWAIGPEPLSQHLANLSVCMHYGLPPFIQDAATVALEQSAETPLAVRTVMQARRKIEIDTLTAIEPARLINPGEGMFILLDVEPLGMTAFEFARTLLDEEKVSVLPCDGFGPGGKYLVRIGLCVDGDSLASACARIKEFTQRCL